MTTTATDVHVTCSEFCGLPITMTGEPGKAQHAENCGATADDLKALDDALHAKRVQIAATAAVEPDEELDEALVDDAPPATFRCKCGEVFPDWPPLGDHQTATGHVGMWAEPNDALDDDALQEREDTVDGAKATINHGKGAKGPKIEKVDYSHLWVEPEIDIKWLFATQLKHDDRDMKVKVASASAACPGKMTVEHEGSRIEVACPHLPIVVQVNSYSCDRGHTHTEVIEPLCMIHHVMKHGGEKAVAGLGPLFPPAAG